MKKIIITADDYGMCTSVDQAIDECIEAGIVTSTNVMLNMDTADNAVALRKKYPHISVGIHWNVTKGKPLLLTDKVRSLVDNNGCFLSIKQFKHRLSKNAIKKHELIAELKAQYNAFYKLCGKPDYWNTHANSALDIRVFNIFSNLAFEYEIPGTRNFQRLYIDIHEVPLNRKVKEFMHKCAADLWFGILLKNKFIMPRARLFPFGIENKLNVEKLIYCLKNNRYPSIEVVIHPATTSNRDYFGVLNDIRVDEYKFFSAQKLKDSIIEADLRLSNFSDI